MRKQKTKKQKQLAQFLLNFVVSNDKTDSVFQNSPIMQFDTTSKWPMSGTTAQRECQRAVSVL